MYDWDKERWGGVEGKVWRIYGLSAWVKKIVWGVNNRVRGFEQQNWEGVELKGEIKHLERADSIVY